MSDILPALRRLITESDERSRSYHSRLAAGPVQLYRILMAFLENVRGQLSDQFHLDYSHFAFYPDSIKQVVCVRSQNGEDQLEPITYEFDSLIEILATQLNAELTVTNSGTVNIDVTDNKGLATLIANIVQRTFPEQIFSDSVVFFHYFTNNPSMESIPSIVGKTRGTLILVLRSPLTEREINQLKNFLEDEYSSYLARIARYSKFDKDAVIGLALSGESKVEELTRILEQEAELKGIGLATSALVHRFVNARINAQWLCDFMKDADAVSARPDLYVKNINELRHQLIRARRLESPLQGVVRQIRNPSHTDFASITSCAVRDLVDLFTDCFNEQVKVERSLRYEGEFDFRILLQPRDLEASLANSKVFISELIREIFFIHLDNVMREVKREETIDKSLILEVSDLGEYVSFSLINFGPPIPRETLSDLNNTIRVRRPHGAGLGVFLSSIIMHEINGKIVFKSPYKNGLGTKVSLLFHKEVS